MGASKERIRQSRVSQTYTKAWRVPRGRIMVASTYPVATLAEACVIRDARGMLSRCALLLGDGVNVSVHVAHIHDTRTKTHLPYGALDKTSYK